MRLVISILFPFASGVALGQVSRAPNPAPENLLRGGSLLQGTHGSARLCKSE